MRTKTITLYQFEELSDAAKENARVWWRQLDFDDWWNGVYEDAENIGLKITSFDTGRANDITGEFTHNPQDVVAAILRDHGPDTETHKTAARYAGKLTRMETYHDSDLDTEYQEEEDDEDAIAEFLHDLLEDYLIMLRKEHEWLNEDEQVDENIIINEYEFTEDGRIA